MEDIDLPLTRLKFGNIGLGCAQQLSGLFLVELGIQARFFKLVDQFSMLLGVD